MHRSIPFVIRKNDMLIFNTGTSQKYEIFYSDSPYMENPSFFFKGNQPKCEILAPSSNRLFFNINHDDYSHTFSTRHLTNINTVNFRDLGGYYSNDGRRVKWGRFYRGAHLADLTTDDLVKLNKMDIKTVFDFRSASEVNDFPNIIPTGINYINKSGITGIENSNDIFTKEGNDNLDIASLIVKYADHPSDLAEINNFLPQFYLSMGKNPSTFVSFLQHIFKNNVPVFFHCSAGKDRTGFAASLILSVLGVPRETIIEDYLLSNVYRQSDNASILNYVETKTHSQNALDSVNNLLSVRPELLDSTYNQINKAYGSFNNFLLKEVKINSNDIDCFKNLYLE